MQRDYAGSWMSERGRCFRLITDGESGRPKRCPEPVMKVGWRRYQGTWLALDACEQHYGQLEVRPRP